MEHVPRISVTPCCLRARARQSHAATQTTASEGEPIWTLIHRHRRFSNDEFVLIKWAALIRKAIRRCKLRRKFAFIGHFLNACKQEGKLAVRDL